MNIYTCTKESFAVIGKEGSTSDGENFIGLLWDDVNSHFAEIAHLAKKEEAGNLGCDVRFFPFVPGVGRTLQQGGFIWRGWNVTIRQMHRKAGRNGCFPPMNICMLNAKMKILFLK